MEENNGMTMLELAKRCEEAGKEAAAKIFSMPSDTMQMDYVSTAFRELYFVRNVVMNVKCERLFGMSDKEIVDGLMEVIGVLEAMYKDASGRIENGK